MQKIAVVYCCKDAGIHLVDESVIGNETPAEDTLAACKALGAALLQ